MTEQTGALIRDASDNPASRKSLAEVSAELTPALDALGAAVVLRGGTMCVAVEVDGHLVKRRSLRCRFDVRLRDPDDGIAVEQEFAPVGSVDALLTAYHTLRSYQYGNAALGPAKDIADRLKSLLGQAGVDAP